MVCVVPFARPYVELLAGPGPRRRLCRRSSWIGHRRVGICSPKFSPTRSPMPCDSIPRRLLGQAKVRPEAPAHYVKEGGFWRMTSYREYADEIRRAGKALIA